MARSNKLMKQKKTSLKKNKTNVRKSKHGKKRRSSRKVKIMIGGATVKILLIIDPQNDFTDQKKTHDKRVPQFTSDPFDQLCDSKGLAVPGAKTDLDKLVSFLTKNGDKFDEIHVSLDSHTPNHICHIGFWNRVTTGRNEEQPRPLQTFYVKESEKNVIYIGNWNGTHQEPEVIVTTKDPKLQEWAYMYVLQMQKNNVSNPSKPIPCLWAEHCIIEGLSGTDDGWHVYDPLRAVLNTMKGKVFYHEKGTNDLVEMYSIFSAELPYEDLKEQVSEACRSHVASMYASKIVPTVEIIPTIENVPNTQHNYNTTFNDTLFKRLIGNGTNKIYVCGEAKSHCVKTSLEDMLDHCESYKYSPSNIIVFEDLTSPIPGFEIPTETAYETMKTKGLEITSTTAFEKETAQ